MNAKSTSKQTETAERTEHTPLCSSAVLGGCKVISPNPYARFSEIKLYLCTIEIMPAFEDDLEKFVYSFSRAEKAAMKFSRADAEKWCKLINEDHLPFQAAIELPPNN